MADANGSTDADLLGRIAAGDRQAAARLVERYQAGLLRFARAVVGDEATAEDVLQDTFVAALASARSYRGEASVKTWLYTIARHEAFRRKRRAARFELDDDLERLGEGAGWGAEGPDAVLEREEARAALSRAFETLDEDDRTILLLRDVEGLDGSETAAILDLGLAAMKSRLHRARLRLLSKLRTEACHHGG